MSRHPRAEDCPFCRLGDRETWMESEHAVAFRDSFPVTEGHTLVVPKRHARSVFDIPPEELADLWALVGAARRRLLEELRPAALNIGVNDGTAAGQTIGHGHVHLIPRRIGDVADPRGGVRWIIPEKAKYWP